VVGPAARHEGLRPERATKVMAANQGLYNGFLVAGLLWGLSLGDDGYAITAFFLGCVAVAGLFGAATSSIRILYIQTVPAVLALLALMLGV
jgi:putative membrane protein